MKIIIGFTVFCIAMLTAPCVCLAVWGALGATIAIMLETAFLLAAYLATGVLEETYEGDRMME